MRTGVTVRELTRTEAGFAVVTGPTTTPERIEADAVVLATPAAPTARLLTEVVPSAAAELAEIEYASVVVVTLAFRTDDVRGLDDSSGFLVPPVDGRAIKASTFSFAKWGWVREAGAAQGLVHLRTSLGRHGEEATLQRTDDELVAASLADLAEAAGISAAPVATHVQRWGGGLPQYAVGHLDRVARIRAAVAGVPGWCSAGRRRRRGDPGGDRLGPRGGRRALGGTQLHAALAGPRGQLGGHPVVGVQALDHPGQVGAVQPADQRRRHPGHRVERAAPRSRTEPSSRNGSKPCRASSSALVASARSGPTRPPRRRARSAAPRATPRSPATRSTACSARSSARSVDTASTRIEASSPPAPLGHPDRDVLVRRLVASRRPAHPPAGRQPEPGRSTPRSTSLSRWNAASLREMPTAAPPRRA